MKNAQLPEGKLSALCKRNSNAIADLFADSLPAFPAPIWPTKGTRAYEALTALIKGPQNQADYFDGWRLAAYVKSLEYLGWRIVSNHIARPNCRKPISEYRLDITDPGVKSAIAGKGVAA